MLGRPWAQAQVFGLTPDATVLGSLGLLLLLQPGRQPAAVGWGLWWALWPLPLAWCAVSAATLWALHAPEALLLPLAALVALAGRRA